MFVLQSGIPIELGNHATSQHFGHFRDGDVFFNGLLCFGVDYVRAMVREGGCQKPKNMQTKSIALFFFFLLFAQTWWPYI